MGGRGGGLIDPAFGFDAEEDAFVFVEVELGAVAVPDPDLFDVIAVERKRRWGRG